MNDPKFNYEIGYATAQLDTIESFQKAFDLGEIEEFLAYKTPKEMEAWDEWHANHPEGYEERWMSEGALRYREMKASERKTVNNTSDDN